MPIDDEVFGSPEQALMARRSAALWSLLQNDARFAWYGRLVALSEPGPDAAELLSAMAKLQGAAVAYFFPSQDAPALFAALQARGLSTDRHEHFRGGDAAVAASRKVLAAVPMPADLTVLAIDERTPHGTVRAVADLCASCDVMPVSGAVMRGRARKGICLVALDPQAQPVATASSYVIHHPSSPHAADVFWGMLATRADRRGEKIGLLLGAQAIVHMADHHGARGFMTGVRDDNPSSRALCEKLGVFQTDWSYASCIDTSLFGAATVTK